MGRFVRRGQVHDPMCMPCDPVDGRGRGAGWGRPHEKDHIDAIQASLKGLGIGEVAAHDLDSGRKAGVVGIASERADSAVGVQ
jgi:hypothetical protein